MNFNQTYADLATKLGDIAYKMAVLEVQRQSLIVQIQKLDELAGMAARAKQEAATNEAKEEKT